MDNKFLLNEKRNRHKLAKIGMLNKLIFHTKKEQIMTEVTPNNQLESEEWAPYLTYLIAFLCVVSFFFTFWVVYKGFIMVQFATYLLSISTQDLYLFGGITGIGGFFAIFTRRLADHPKFGRKYSLLLFLIVSFSMAIWSFFIYNLILNVIVTFILSIFMINTGSLLLAEEVPARYRGRAAGIVASVGMSSSIFASFLSTQFYLWPQHAWQHFFLIVMLSGIVILVVMSLWIKETKRFTVLKNKDKQNKVKLKDIFNKKNMKPLILVSSLVFLGSNFKSQKKK